MSDNPKEAAADLLIQEVDEELRHDELNKLWKKYANHFAAASIALVLAVAAWQGWQAWDAKQRQESSRRFAEASQLAKAGRSDDALEALAKLSVDGTSGYRVLADLKRAQLREGAGDPGAASAIYHVIADSNADPVYRGLARLKAAYLDLDGTDPSVVEKSVEPLAVEASPWRHSAREIQALAALKRGDDQRATEIFKKLADDVAAPQGIRARAAEMLSLRQSKGKN